MPRDLAKECLLRVDKDRACTLAGRVGLHHGRGPLPRMLGCLRLQIWHVHPHGSQEHEHPVLLGRCWQRRGRGDGRPALGSGAAQSGTGEHCLHCIGVTWRSRQRMRRSSSSRRCPTANARWYCRAGASRRRTRRC